ncbi:MAG: ATP-binding cassette domain-containing protein, partial [Acidobacteriota bacterium]
MPLGEERELSGLAVLRRSWRRVLGQIEHLPRALGLLTQATGALSYGWLALLVLAGLRPAVSLPWTPRLVDALAAAAGAGGSWAALAVPAAVLGLVLVLTEALGAWQRLLTGLQSERAADHLTEAIQRQALAVDLERYDDPGFYDRLHRARYQAAQHPAALLESGGSLLRNGLTLLAMAGLLLPYGWWLPLVLMLSTLPAVVGALAIQLEDYHQRRRTTPERRRAWYLDHLMSERESAAELRVLGLGGFLRRTYRELRLGLRAQRERLARRRLLFETLAALLALGAAAGVLLLMVRRYLDGAATLGDLALFAQAFSQGQRLMRSLLENVGNLYGHLFDLGDLFAFLDLPARPDEAAASSSPLTLEREIRLRGVVYSYPAADPGSRPALDGASMTLAAGEIHAVVGANGAGKSTLVKL